MTVHIEEGNWQGEVEKSEIPVLVDFWAEWCGPCRTLAPILDELDKEFDGKIKIVKVDVEKNPGLVGKFGIRSVPTLLVLKNGDEKERLIGSMSKAVLVSKLKAYL